jgi:hypothetical protein
MALPSPAPQHKILLWLRNELLEATRNAEEDALIGEIFHFPEEF